MEATKEEGEPSPAALAFSATGISVWFKWEATSTGFVTVDTCGSQISTTLGVYTGTAVNALTEVAGDFSSLGPDCSTFRGTAVTFRAISGVTYEIQVEGRPTFPEEAGFGQGPFELDLDATPVPVNDDFSDATVLSGQMLQNGVYAAGASGFTWNATKEPGEPEHAGDPGGASVWYSWTAPFSDPAVLTACGRFEKTLLGVYTGSSVNSLTQIATDDRSCSFLEFAASTGTTYRIAIDGRYDSGSGAALMGSIPVNLVREPPSSGRTVGGSVEREIRISRPNTTIHKRVLKRWPPIWIFSFDSSEPESTFRCKLDKHPFAKCSPRKRYRNLPPGRHTLKAFAVDPAGSADPSPAAVPFIVAGGKKAHPRD